MYLCHRYLCLIFMFYKLMPTVGYVQLGAKHNNREEQIRRFRIMLRHPGRSQRGEVCSDSDKDEWHRAVHDGSGVCVCGLK